MTNKEIDRYRDRCFDLWDEDKTEMTIEKFWPECLLC